MILGSEASVLLSPQTEICKSEMLSQVHNDIVSLGFSTKPKFAKFETRSEVHSDIEIRGFSSGFPTTPKFENPKRVQRLKHASSSIFVSSSLS